jgi:hypothetical protein
MKDSSPSQDIDLPHSRSTVEARQTVVNELHSEIFAERIAKREVQKAHATPPSGELLNLDDAELLERARNAKNGAQFAQLYDRGDWKSSGLSSQSEADLALASRLSFWTGRDRARVDQLFRQSGLMREKWERDDYRSRTLDEALAGGEVYTPRAHGLQRKVAPDTTVSIDLNSQDNSQGNASAPEEEEVWPDPPDDCAFYGLAGEFVRAVEPYCEGDRVALLAQFLTAAGNVRGRKIYHLTGRTEHYPNLFTVIVGDTGTSRKGLSWDWVESVFKELEPGFLGIGDGFRERVRGGLSSGEGLIWAVRDPRSEARKVSKGADRHTEMVVVDAGVTDKRMIILETEFSSALKVAARAENILTEIIRCAFDGRHILQTLTKNSPAKATDAHISIIAHITPGELTELLNLSDIASSSRFPILSITRYSNGLSAKLWKSSVRRSSAPAM